MKLLESRYGGIFFCSNWRTWKRPSGMKETSVYWKKMLHHALFQIGLLEFTIHM